MVIGISLLKSRWAFNTGWFFYGPKDLRCSKKLVRAELFKFPNMTDENTNGVAACQKQCRSSCGNSTWIVVSFVFLMNPPSGFRGLWSSMIVHLHLPSIRFVSCKKTTLCEQPAMELWGCRSAALRPTDLSANGASPVHNWLHVCHLPQGSQKPSRLGEVTHGRQPQPANMWARKSFGDRSRTFVPNI